MLAIEMCFYSNDVLSLFKLKPLALWQPEGYEKKEH